jgi:8-oxo-dGTP diphosphatase
LVRAIIKDNMRTRVETLVQMIQPYDALEQEQISATLTWIASGAPLCRIAKPDVPPQHLVAYFVLVDLAQEKLLLVDHKNAGLWLPGGGHVEPGEHPQATVRRELSEELAISADFLWVDPLFLTVTRTMGATAGHRNPLRPCSILFLFYSPPTPAIHPELNNRLIYVDI